MLLIGFFSGIITGLLSIGGGFISIFSLLFITPLISDTEYSMHTIAGFSMMLAFFSTLSGSVHYIKEKLIDLKLVYYIGIPSFVGGLLGAVTSSFVSELILKIIFVLLAIAAAIIMQFPTKNVEKTEKKDFSFYIFVLSILGGLIIGFLGGLIGLAAGFIFVPVMVYFYKLPIKKAIGTSLITCFLLSLGSLVIKIGVDNIPLGLGTMLVIGGIIGAQIGGKINKSIPSLKLKKIASYAIFIVSLKLLFDIFNF